MLKFFIRVRTSITVQDVATVAASAGPSPSLNLQIESRRFRWNSTVSSMLQRKILSRWSNLKRLGIKISSKRVKMYCFTRSLLLSNGSTSTSCFGIS